MALTVNTVPDNIDNSATFNVTTSLSEDASHINLRVRCAITVGGVVISTIERPKGLADFDLAEILKPHVPGVDATRNSGHPFRTTGGAPLVKYTVLFTEVWENSSGVTQTGDTDNASGTTYYYVPATIDNFTPYVCVDDSTKFASETINNGVMRFHSGYQYFLLFFTEETAARIYYGKDALPSSYEAISSIDGWGAILIADEELMRDVVSYLTLQLFDSAGSGELSDMITIYKDSTCVPEREILEYTGRLGGKEYLDFEGKKERNYKSQRNFISAAGKNRLPLSYYGFNSQILETRFKDIDNSEYLKTLLMSEDVKRLEPSYATPTDVTVITDSVKIINSELFTNEIEIEYED